MLGDNIKNLRKQKGFTQEELAIRLHVVRQTVSKWEKRLSVPDAEMLQRLADILEVDVKQLLGARLDWEQNSNEVVEQLARINEQLVIKNRRSRRTWRIVAIVLIAWVVLCILSIAGDMILNSVAYKSVTTETTVLQEIP